MSQRVISYGSAELMGFCKMLAIGDRRVPSLLEETLLLHWTQNLNQRTQTVVTNGSDCRTLCTSGPYLVHAATYVVATRTIVTHVQIVVYAFGNWKRCKPTANCIRIGPH